VIDILNPSPDQLAEVNRDVTLAEIAPSAAAAWALDRDDGERVDDLAARDLAETAVVAEVGR